MLQITKSLCRPDSPSWVQRSRAVRPAEEAVFMGRTVCVLWRMRPLSWDTALVLQCSVLSLVKWVLHTQTWSTLATSIHVVSPSWPKTFPSRMFGPIWGPVSPGPSRLHGTAGWVPAPEGCGDSAGHEGKEACAPPHAPPHLHKMERTTK